MITLAQVATRADQKGLDIDAFLPTLKDEATIRFGGCFEFTEEQYTEIAEFIMENCPQRKEILSHSSRCQVTLHGYDERFCTCR